MPTVNQDFPSAPMGRRVSGAIVFAMLAAVAGTASALFAMLHQPAHARRPISPSIFLAPLAVPLLLLPVALYQRSRVAQIRIEENCLLLGKKRYPLEGLTGIVRDPAILRWAFRTGGNGGLGAIVGRFRSKRVGKFEAFMTDTEKAVVLRWPERTVAVSPQDPEFFIYTVRRASGLK
jgi:hypothetical protein